MKSLALAGVLLLAAPSDHMTFTATSVNVAQPGTPVKITILRWSTDDERTPLLTTLNPPPAPIVARNPNPDDPPQGAAARGRGALAGRGRGRGRGGAAAPLSPIEAFTAALGRAPTLGYVWTSDITGYAIKYTWHAPLPDGTERIVLASDRRLGAYSAAWKPATPAAETDYAFTVFELHVSPSGTLEGKTSLTSKIAIDSDANTVAIESWGTAPAILQNVKR